MGSHRNQELSRPELWLLRSVLFRAAGIVASGHSQLDFGKLRPACGGPSWDAGRIWASLYKAFGRCPRTLIHWFAPFNTVCSRSVWVSSSIMVVKKGEHLLVSSILWGLCSSKCFIHKCLIWLEEEEEVEINHLKIKSPPCLSIMKISGKKDKIQNIDRVVFEMIRVWGIMLVGSSRTQMPRQESEMQIFVRGDAWER